MTMRPRRHAYLLGLVLLGVGCAIPGARPSASAKPDRSGFSAPPSMQLLQQQLEDDARLDDVGSALLRAAVPRCRETTRRTGIRLTNLAAFPRPWQQAAEDLDITDTVQVLSVAKGSGADRAGVRAGDRILALDGFSAQPGSRVVEAVRSRLATAAERGAPSVQVTLRRDGRELPLTIPLDSSCAMAFMSWRQDAPEAWSDGRTIVVTTGMLRFAAKEEEDLAIVLAHEIAHAVVLQASERTPWQSVVHGTGDLLTSAASLASSDRWLRMKGARRELPWDDASERSADEAASAILGAAGRSTRGLHDFWRRALLPDPSEFPYAITHPMSMERILWLDALEKTVPPEN